MFSVLCRLLRCSVGPQLTRLGMGNVEYLTVPEQNRIRKPYQEPNPEHLIFKFTGINFKFIINLPTRKKHRREAVKDHKVT